jgi:hypothetical protein
LDQVSRVGRLWPERSAKRSDDQHRIPEGPETQVPPSGHWVRFCLALRLDQLVDDVRQQAYVNARSADPDGQRVLGFRYARNQITHGVQVVAVAEINPANAVLGLAVLGETVLGTPANLTWRAFGDLPLLPQGFRRPQQEASLRALRLREVAIKGRLVGLRRLNIAR